ncbi:hypothetical protein LDDCCGHA_2274 [Methylobacterium oxalidis]|nr:hypothetical protein LDDCCGHA_2274 [Methylobacterium oxalidis]
MAHLMQSVRSYYDHLCWRIAASAARHEAEAERLRAELAKQAGAGSGSDRQFVG